jgi:hypothetical protein
MSNRLKEKWGLLVASATLAAVGMAQCISDFVQDAIVFSVID